MTASRGDPAAGALPPTLVPRLVAWYRRERRPLPWRQDRDPYRVWVAEVLLQQTRVAQATPYFERFVRRFPTVGSLARSPLEPVLKAWEGAGYYARARHLHAAARLLVARHGGSLPRDVDALERLPGIGRYIARAIASIAFGVSAVALEANGRRVAARWLLEEGDVGSSAGQRRLESALAAALGKGSAGEFNEAVMELGETLCLARRPRCAACPVRSDCRAVRERTDPGSIPRRVRRKPRPHLRAALVILTGPGGRWLVQRRPPRGLLGGLWEFPGGKIRSGELPARAARRELWEETRLRVGRLKAVGTVRHAYSHFTVELHVFQGPLVGRAPPSTRTRRWVTARGLRALPTPKATEKVVRRLAPDAAGRASRGSGSPRGRTAA